VCAGGGGGLTDTIESVILFCFRAFWSRRVCVRVIFGKERRGEQDKGRKNGATGKGEGRGT